MRSNKHTLIIISRALLTLGSGVLVSNHALAADCTDVSGTTVTITGSCENNLQISGDGSNVTINSGVNIRAGKHAVGTKNGTNITIN